MKNKPVYEFPIEDKEPTYKREETHISKLIRTVKLMKKIDALNNLEDMFNDKESQNFLKEVTGGLEIVRVFSPELKDLALDYVEIQLNPDSEKYQVRAKVFAGDWKKRSLGPAVGQFY